MNDAKLLQRVLWVVILLNSQRTRASWRWIDPIYCKDMPADPGTCEETKGVWICQTIVDGKSIKRGWACMFRDVGIVVNGPSGSRSLQGSRSERSGSDNTNGPISSRKVFTLEGTFPEKIAKHRLGNRNTWMNQ
uniref:Uncharacterized protein K04H4.2 n=1 Tax=Lygus hesperus TaxID=30085 RepID=A0A0A9XWV3_LYGHE